MKAASFFKCILLPLHCFIQKHFIYLTTSRSATVILLWQVGSLMQIAVAVRRPFKQLEQARAGEPMHVAASRDDRQAGARDRSGICLCVCV